MTKTIMKTTKVKIKSKVTSEIEIEVTLPYFSTDSVCHWYKVISETKMIKIYEGTTDCSVEITQYNISGACDSEKTQITEAEFINKFNKVINLLNDKMVK